MHERDDEALVLRTWRRVCQTRDGEPTPDLSAVLDAYAAPSRHYHNLHHVAECLRELGSVEDQCRSPEKVAAALLFHDCVYDPMRHDNEERSAEVAERMLTAAGGYGPRDVADVRDLILATKHAALPSDPDQQIIVDIDLAILGKPAAEYEAYELAIRREYAHVSDAAFAAGRAAFLRGILARPTIYSTQTFRARDEQPARQNLLSALRRCATERTAEI